MNARKLQACLMNKNGHMRVYYSRVLKNIKYMSESSILKYLKFAKLYPSAYSHIHLKSADSVEDE